MSLEPAGFLSQVDYGRTRGEFDRFRILTESDWPCSFASLLKK